MYNINHQTYEISAPPIYAWSQNITIIHFLVTFDPTNWLQKYLQFTVSTQKIGFKKYAPGPKILAKTSQNKKVWFGHTKRDVMRNFWRDIICCFEWTAPDWLLPIPAPDTLQQIAAPDTCLQYLPPIPWANQRPSSFKAADHVPPEILHDISLLKRSCLIPCFGFEVMKWLLCEQMTV